MTIILVFDTETSGLIPKSSYSELEDLNIDILPHMIQLSYICYDIDNNMILSFNDNIIQNNSIVLNSENIKIHKITNKMIQKSSYDVKNAIIDFMNVYTNVDILVGHNINFDIKILLIELIRLKKNDDNMIWKIFYNLLLKKTKFYCTMKNSIEICNLNCIGKNGKHYIKYPKLNELYKHYYSVEPRNLHNAFNDCLITLICYIKMNYNYDVINKNKTIKELIKLII